MPVIPAPDPISGMAAKLAAKSFSELLARLTNSVLDAVGTPARHAYELITANFHPHLNATFIRCTKVKTILNREEPADLLSLYVGLNFRCAEKPYDDIEVIEEIHNRRRAVISGTGGGGKTFFMKYLWLTIFENPCGKIPVFIELRKLNEEKSDSLLTFIYQTIVNTNANVSEEIFRRGIRKGIFTFLLDGFDELAFERRESVTKQILELAGNNPECTIVVSSRPDQQFASWQAFSTFTVQPLTKKQTLMLIEKINYEETTKTKFCERIERDLWRQHESFLSSPLLATMMLMTFSEFADIPQKVHLFYEQAFETLFYKHDAVKELYQRKMYTSLPSDIFKRYFSLFCLVSYYEGTYEYSEDEIKKFIEKGLKIEGATLETESFLRDLTESICIMQKDGLKFIFSHRSFQEYFSAYCLDRVLQKQSEKILDRIGVRSSDDTVLMLFDMNEDLVEDAFVLPVLDELFKSAGSTNRSDFLAKHFHLLRTELMLEFRNGKFNDWHVGSRESIASKLTMIQRLFRPMFANMNNKKYHDTDDAILRSVFPEWEGRSKARKPSGSKGGNINIESIRVGRRLELAITESDGMVPAALDIGWVGDMGYAQWCKDMSDKYYEIRLHVRKRRQTKTQSIDEVLDLR